VEKEEWLTKSIKIDRFEPIKYEDVRSIVMLADLINITEDLHNGSYVYQQLLKNYRKQ